jgi:hypothetical protein
MSEPTLETILSRYRKGEDRLSRFYAEFDEAEAFYESDWDPGGPADFPHTTPATASAIIDEATDHIDTENITPHVPTIGKKRQNEESAGKIKDFIIGAWSYFASHSESPPLRDFVENQFKGGKGILRILPDFDCWPEPEITEGMTNKEKDDVLAEARVIRNLDFPLVCSSISPRSIIEDPTIGRKTWVIEHYEKDVEEVEAAYAAWVNPRSAEKVSKGGASAYDSLNVEIIDYWQLGTKPADSGDVKARLAEKVGETIYGCWRIILGDGAIATSGFNAGYPLPFIIKYTKKGRGILHPVRSLLRAEGRRDTQLDVMMAFYGTPALVTDAEEDFTFKWEPGWLNRVPPGRKVDAINVPVPAAALLATVSDIRSGIEKGTFGSVVGGEKQPGTRSAAEHAILSAQAELRFSSVKKGVEDAIRQIDEKMLAFLRDVLLVEDSDDIIVPTADDTMEAPPSLKKTDIPSPFYHSIELKDMSPAALSRDALVAAQLHQAGIIDVEEAMERSGITNTADMKLRIMRDKVIDTPLWVNHMSREVVESYTGQSVEDMEFEESLIALHAKMKQQQAAGGMGTNQAAAPIGLGAMQGQTGMIPGGPEQLAQQAGVVSNVGRLAGTGIQ